MSRSVSLCFVLFCCAFGQSGAPKLPPLKKQPSVKAVIDEHLDALNRCDWNRLMAQYPPDVEIFLPGGQTVKGREEVGKLFAAIVKPFQQGGLCGVKFEPEHSFLAGNTLSVAWRVVGEVLAEPYRGADAYITRDGLMAAQVTTFQRDQMKTKR
jgi:hypothetical protein